MKRWVRSANTASTQTGHGMPRNLLVPRSRKNSTVDRDLQPLGQHVGQTRRSAEGRESHDDRADLQRDHDGPFTKPARDPDDQAQHHAPEGGTPSRSSIATATVVRLVVAPIEMSRPPEITTTIWATASTPRMATAIRDVDDVREQEDLVARVRITAHSTIEREDQAEVRRPDRVPAVRRPTPPGPARELAGPRGPGADRGAAVDRWESAGAPGPGALDAACRLA